MHHHLPTSRPHAMGPRSLSPSSSPFVLIRDGGDLMLLLSCLLFRARVVQWRRELALRLAGRVNYEGSACRGQVRQTGRGRACSPPRTGGWPPPSTDSHTPPRPPLPQVPCWSTVGSSTSGLSPSRSSTAQMAPMNISTLPPASKPWCRSCRPKKFEEAQSPDSVSIELVF